jgi:hypothetical protein
VLRTPHKLRCVYDYDPAEVAELGWDRFVSTAWESIFVGYNSYRGIRTLGRRWSDLIQGGLGCSQQLADDLVREQVVLMEGRPMLSSKDPLKVLAGMDEVLADMGADLAELAEIRPAERSRLVAELARMRRFVRESSFGPEPDSGSPVG